MDTSEYLILSLDGFNLPTRPEDERAQRPEGRTMMYQTSKGWTIEVEMTETRQGGHDLTIRLPGGNILARSHLPGPLVYEHYQIKRAIGLLCQDADRELDRSER